MSSKKFIMTRLNELSDPVSLAAGVGIVGGMFGLAGALDPGVRDGVRSVYYNYKTRKYKSEADCDKLGSKEEIIKCKKLFVKKDTNILARDSRREINPLSERLYTLYLKSQRTKDPDEYDRIRDEMIQLSIKINARDNIVNNRKFIKDDLLKKVDEKYK